MVKKYTENYRLDIAYATIFRNLKAIEVIPIHTALDISSGDNLTKKDMVPGEHIVYGGGGETGNTHSEFNIDYKTIGIGRVGARCGCVFEIIPNSWVTDNALIIQSYDKRFSLDFLRHFLSYSELGQYANNAMQPVISKTRINDVAIPLIDIEEQNTLSKILDSIEKNEKFESNSYDLLKSKIKIIDNWETLNEEIEIQNDLTAQLKQSILQEAIQGKLTADWREQNPNSEPASELLKRIKAEKAQLIKDKKIRKGKTLPPITAEEIPFELPEGWVWCRLGEIFQTTSGGTPNRSISKYWNGSITWYKSGELNDGLLSDNSQEKITELGLKESSATLFPEGTLLIAMYGATAGKLGILGRDATTNQAVCGFYKNQLIETKYLFNFLMANRSKIISESWGMSQPNISQTYLKNFVFALPPIDEQKSIVEKVKDLMETVEQLKSEITHSEQNAQMLMQAVLKEAFESKKEEVHA